MIEKIVTKTVTIPQTITTEVQKTVIKIVRETVRFEVSLTTRRVRVDRIERGFDVEGVEVYAAVHHLDFDFAEVLPKLRNKITGLDVYKFLRAEFDERDPL